MSTVNRREFLEIAGCGLLIVVAEPSADAQRGGGSGGAGTLETRLHVGEDGFITVLSGKIEEGQGALTELAMAAASSQSNSRNLKRRLCVSLNRQKPKPHAARKNPPCTPPQPSRHYDAHPARPARLLSPLALARPAFAGYWRLPLFAHLLGICHRRHLNAWPAAGHGAGNLEGVALPPVYSRGSRSRSAGSTYKTFSLRNITKIGKATCR